MSRGRVLMIQGTASSAGKSFLVAGLCRLFVQEGLRVAPFKAQNMSNNAFVTIDGHEIGRAQAVQAMGARLVPHVDMNPVLLKPEADHRSQVIVMGRPVATLNAAAYQEAKEHIWEDVTGALDRLRDQYDLVIVEGAGSPAEINLKARDISNMRVALYAQAPVLIAGDIDRGGVFAHLYGTYWLLDPEERALVKGFLINKFRGDPSLLEPGLTDIEGLTGVPVAGVVPWLRDVHLPEEDAVAIERRTDPRGTIPGIDIAVLHFPRIANFDDFDPLEEEPDVRVRYVHAADELGDPDIIVLPGTKATMADLDWLRSSGFEQPLHAARERGVAILGICGGYQALGDNIADPMGTESSTAEIPGLGLLPVTTVFGDDKTTAQSTASVVADAGVLRGLAGTELAGYEIHTGATQVEGGVAIRLAGGQPLGAIDESGRVFGCYLHGLFHNDAFRRGFLANVAGTRGKRYAPAMTESVEASFDRLADALRSSIDLPLLFRLVGLER